MKRGIKKVFALAVIMLLVISSFAACGGGSGDEGEGIVKIGIIQLTEHPSLNTIHDSIVAELADDGYVDGENIEIDYQNGQNDMSVMKTIVQKFVANECDIIIAIATPAAQAALSETSEIPIIFAAVTDPVAAGLVDSNDAPGGNVTGTSDEVSAEMIMDLAKQITPGFKKIGALYSSSEDNSVSVIGKLKEYAAANDFEVIESAVTNTSEAKQAAQYLADNVDVVFSPTDNTIASSMATVTEIFNEAGIPFYAGADSMVQDGALATYGINYTILGQETAHMAEEVIEGTGTPADMPVKSMSDMSIYVNTDTAKALNVEIPSEILEKATVFTSEE